MISYHFSFISEFSAMPVAAAEARRQASEAKLLAKLQVTIPQAGKDLQNKYTLCECLAALFWALGLDGRTYLTANVVGSFLFHVAGDRKKGNPSLRLIKTQGPEHGGTKPVSWTTVAGVNIALRQTSMFRTQQQGIVKTQQDKAPSEL